MSSETARYEKNLTDIVEAEPWHRRGSGNDLRAAVLGANDGLNATGALIGVSLS
jgi:hypothetical protein